MSTPLPIKPATTLFLLLLALTGHFLITNAQDESTPAGENKCGSCVTPSPPPPSPPPPVACPPPPPPPKKPPSSYCPPPPATYIITGPPGDLYPVDPYFYGSAGRVSAGLIALVGSTLVGLLVGFW